MTPIARLLGLALPACGVAGPREIALMEPLPLSGIRRRKKNTAIAAPAGFTPAPDFTTPIHQLPADGLLETVASIAKAQARVWLAASFPARHQLHWVARSRFCNFPDLITAQTVPRDPTSSTLLLFSRSLYGYSDFGVNRRRFAGWLAAVASSAERLPTR